MSALFGPPLTLSAADLVRVVRGPCPAPDYATRGIYQAWRAIADPTPRVRYYRLHQEFQHIPIAVLEAVIREFEADE
jgi:hypothetical protein